MAICKELNAEGGSFLKKWFIPETYFKERTAVHEVPRRVFSF